MSTDQLYGRKAEDYTTQWGTVHLEYANGVIEWTTDIGGQPHTGKLPAESNDLSAAFHKARTQLDTILPTLSHKPDDVPAEQVAAPAAGITENVAPATEPVKE